jgi:N-acetyl-anhydromuramyl-L-alanine amidase AmpD
MTRKRAVAAMQIIKAFLTQNPCYTANVERADARYRKFQDEGPRGLMLHSVGCAQPDASVFVNRWNKPTYTNACVHAFIDANTGDVWQTLPWNFRGWHGGGSCNNTHIGVEMCESKHIKYTTGAKFTVLDKAKAQADARRAYNSAVELFAYLCETYAIDPETGIISHREGGKQGIASGHVDPEHYWQGLDLPYTMDTFRAAVKEKVDKEDVIYRVQVGAFRNKAYAEAFLAKVRAVYPNAYITKGGG